MRKKYLVIESWLKYELVSIYSSSPHDLHLFLLLACTLPFEYLLWNSINNNKQTKMEEEKRREEYKNK